MKIGQDFLDILYHQPQVQYRVKQSAKYKQSVPSQQIDHPTDQIVNRPKSWVIQLT